MDCNCPKPGCVVAVLQGDIGEGMNFWVLQETPHQGSMLIHHVGQIIGELEARALSLSEVL